MKYAVQLCLLTGRFLQDDPSSCFPERLLKQKRPCVSLLLEIHDYFICIPFRLSCFRLLKIRKGMDFYFFLSYNVMISEFL